MTPAPSTRWPDLGYLHRFTLLSLYGFDDWLCDVLAANDYQPCSVEALNAAREAV